MSRGFRVWDVEAEEYLPNSNGTGDGVLGISADGKNVIWIKDGEATFFEDGRSVIIERDTGLKDKNGKMIREGDIVRLYNRFVSAITWEDDYCGFKWYNEGEGRGGLGKGNEEYYEVIGNIHENKELLGECDG